jgi:hypothetical protein
MGKQNFTTQFEDFGEERMTIQKDVDELLGEKTIYRYYEPVVGGIAPQFKFRTERSTTPPE